MDNACYFRVTGTATITTYGEIRNPDGSISYVPMGGVTYVYYEAYCDPSTGMIPGTEPGGSSYLPLKPKVALKSVDTTDPYRPLLVVDVDSDPYAPATMLTVTMNSGTVAQLPLVGNGEYEVALPSVNTFSFAGTKAITAKACTAANSCGTVSGSMSRNTPSPLSKTVTLSARYVVGDDGWRYASYEHQFNQSYMTTSFSMPELGQNSRRQLRNSLIKLQWNSSVYDAIFSAHVYTSGTIYGSSASATPTCAFVPPCSGYCAHRCVDSRLFGFFITAEDEVRDMVKSDLWVPISIISGRTLRHQIP